MVAFAMRPGTPNVSGNETTLAEQGATVVNPCYLLASDTVENDVSNAHRL